MFPKLFMGLTYCIATHPCARRICFSDRVANILYSSGCWKCKAQRTNIDTYFRDTYTYAILWFLNVNMKTLSTYKLGVLGVTIASKVNLYVSGVLVDNYMARAMTNNYCWKSGTCRFDWEKRWNKILLSEMNSLLSD